MPWLQLVKVLAPIIIPLVAPKAVPVVPYIAHGIAKAEELTGTGPDKLRIAREIIDAGIRATNQLMPGAIDHEAATATLDHGISTVIAVANLLHRQPDALRPPDL